MVGKEIIDKPIKSRPKLERITDALIETVDTIKNYHVDSLNGGNADDFNQGVALGLRMALGVLQTRIDCIVLDDKFLKKIGLDVDLDDIAKQINIL